MPRGLAPRILTNLVNTINMNTQNNHRFFAVIASALITFSVSAKDWERTYEFNFQTDSGSPLSIAVRDADVDIIGDTSLQETTIVVTHMFSGGSESDAETYFEREEIVAFQEGSETIVENVIKRPEQRNWFSHGRRHTTIEIRSPYEVVTKAKTSDGDLTVTNVKGETQLRSSDGDITAIKIDGNTQFTSSDGDVSVENVVGDLSAKTSDGDLNLSDVSGDVSALTSDGDIEIDDLKGNLEARTSDGDIDISRLKGSVQAQTSDGSIHIKMDQDPTGDCSLKTSDGDIYISIGHASSLLITARVSDGSIRNKLPDSTTLSVEKRSQTIKVGAGEIKIQAKTSDGSITIGS